jgi:hypothetical protein
MNPLTRLVGVLMCGVLAGGLSAPQSVTARVEPRPTALSRDRDQIALELSRPIAICVTHDDTSHAAFHGCIDWHSSVHGVWALLAYSALTHDQRYASTFRSILTPANLAAEEQYVASHPAFEMPYGRSWFLRLAIEYGRQYDDKLLIHMGDTVAQSLYDRYQRQPALPLSGAYASDSWALINLMDYYSYRGEAAKLAVVKGIVLRDFAAVPVHRCDQNLERSEFMAICSNVAWAVSKAERGPKFTSWLASFFPPDAVTPAISHPLSDHENGLNFSRAWGLWPLYVATGDARYKRAYLDDFQAGYANKAGWNGPYQTVSHWVAQFGMFALRPAFGVTP